MRWSPPLAIDRGDLHHDKLFEQIIKMDSILIHFVIYDTHANNLFLSGNWILIKKCPDNLFVQIVYINCLFIIWCIRYEFSEIAINHDLNPIFTIQAILFNSAYLMLWFLRNIWISLQKCPETWFPGSWLFAFWIMNFLVKMFSYPILTSRSKSVVDGYKFAVFAKILEIVVLFGHFPPPWFVPGVDLSWSPRNERISSRNHLITVLVTYWHQHCNTMAHPRAWCRVYKICHHQTPDSSHRISPTTIITLSTVRITSQQSRKICWVRGGQMYDWGFSTPGLFCFLTVCRFCFWWFSFGCFRDFWPVWDVDRWHWHRRLSVPYQSGDNFWFRAVSSLIPSRRALSSAIISASPPPRPMLAHHPPHHPPPLHPATAVRFPATATL